MSIEAQTQGFAYTYNSNDMRPTGNLAQTETTQKTDERIRSITIRQLDRGYIVEVGCQTLAITNKTELITLFVEYVNNPAATEQKHLEGKLFN